MKEKVLKAVDTVRNASDFVKLISYAGICLIAIVLSLVFSGVKFAFAVNYGGEKIAVIAKKSDFAAAKALALEKIDAPQKEEIIYKPHIFLTITLPERISNVSEVEKAILDNTSELTPGVALSVDNKNVILYPDKAELESAVNEKLNSFNIEGYENSSAFVEKVDLKDIYCKKGDFLNLARAKDKINTLSVKTSVKYTKDVVVKFGTVTEKTDKKLVGYCQVTKAGVNGLNHEVERVEYVDGKEISRENIGQEVVTKPTNQVITIGTATKSVDGKGAQGMIYPLPKNVHSFITTYFGERDVGTHIHKGVDYAAAKNTPIYAVKGGTVTRACYRGDYGNCIIINHGDGVETLYAHCTKLFVSVGEEVKQGQTIGTVGTTGQSTGYHLHFEIKINDSYVNPLKYVKK